MKPHSHFIAERALAPKVGHPIAAQNFGLFQVSTWTDWLPKALGATFNEARWAALDRTQRLALETVHLEHVALHHLSNVKIIFSDNQECDGCGGTFSAHSLVATSGHVKLMTWPAMSCSRIDSPEIPHASFTVSGRGEHLVLIPMQIRHMSAGLLGIWSDAIAAAPASLSIPALLRHGQNLSHKERTWGLVCPHCRRNVPPIFGPKSQSIPTKPGELVRPIASQLAMPARDRLVHENQGWVVSLLRFCPPPL